MAEGSEAESADAPAPARSLGFELTLTVFLGGLSLVLGLVGSASLLHGLAGYPLGLRVADGVFGSAAYVGLWWRRRYPVAYAGYVLVVSLFSTLTGGLSFIAAYTVASQRGWRTALVISSLFAISVWPSLVIYDNNSDGLKVPLTLATVVTFAVTGWGMFVRARRLLLGSLRDRAQRAEESREEHAAHARIAERQRIAREMHDVLAHRLSLLSVQSGALEFAADASPQDIAAAAGAVRTTAHQALQELRSIVHVLRDDEDGTAPPQPVAADLPALLAESATAAAIDADCGDLDLAEVPADTGRTLYRIVQEGLTNARKHAPGSAVEIKLTGTPVDGLSLAITSWLPVGRTAPPAPPGSGTGLIGLRERAVLSGGRIDVTVTEDDRFRLLAWLPWESA
jgi:signal transduction histidine kinase